MNKIILTSIFLIFWGAKSSAQDLSLLKFGNANQAKQNVVTSTALVISDPFLPNTNGSPSDCVSKQSAAVDMRSQVSKGACVIVNAAETIDLNPPFDAQNGSIFDATITTPAPTPTPTPTPTVTKCENFQNHTATDPHLFAKASTNEFYGECISEQIPEYKIAGLTDWKKMTRVCNVVGSNTTFLHIYHEPFDGVDRVTYIRSHDGCTEYPDIRTQRVNPNLLRDWTSLPTLAPITFDKSERILFVNTELEGATIDNDIIIYNIYTDRPIPNLKAKVNGTMDVAFKQGTWGWFVIRPAFDVSVTDYFLAKKDFVLDITTDDWKTAQRFVVYRNHQGGHYTASTTMTRNDGRVFVSTHSCNYEVSQKLVNKTTGKVYTSIPQIDGVFDLGYLDDGDYSFELRTYNDFVAESDILVRVKKKL